MPVRASQCASWLLSVFVTLFMDVMWIRAYSRSVFCILYSKANERNERTVSVWWSLLWLSCIVNLNHAVGLDASLSCISSIWIIIRVDWLIDSITLVLYEAKVKIIENLCAWNLLHLKVDKIGDVLYALSISQINDKWQANRTKQTLSEQPVTHAHTHHTQINTTQIKRGK